MNVGDSTNTIDLTPGTTSGVLYDGMTADGSRVFFTTVRPAHRRRRHDASADIYRGRRQRDRSDREPCPGSRPAPAAPATPTPANPSPTPIREHWNTTGSEEDCGVVAVGGGGGVASGDGTIYFLSPEQLDGSANGVENAPNLYVARPGSPRTSSPPWSRAPTRRCRPPPTRSCAPSAPSRSRPGSRSITRPATSTSSTSTRQSKHRHGLTSSTPPGHPVPSFGSSGKIDRRRAARTSTTSPPRSRSTTTPSSPDLRRPLRPSTRRPASSSKFGPTGEHLASISVGGLPDRRSRSIQTNGNVYVTELLLERHGLSSSTPPATPLTSFPTSQLARPASRSIRAATSTSSTAAASSGTPRHDRDLRLLRHRPRAARRQSLLGGRGRSRRRPRLRRRGQPGRRVRLRRQPRSARRSARDCSKARSASPRTPATLEVSQPRRRPNVAYFGPAAHPSRTPAPTTRSSIDSVSAPGTRQTADFQVTPSGDDAVFTSTLPLTGYDNAESTARSSATTRRSDGLDCASCNPTGEQATGEASLAANGLEPHRRRPRLLQLDRRPGRPRPERQEGRLRVGADAGNGECASGAS